MSKTNEENKKCSQFLSLILRHKPETVGITLDEHGWAVVEDLITAINSNSQFHMDLDRLTTIVETDNKQRYSFDSEDKRLIRANQGHSIPVDVELQEEIPPDVLYHGTGMKYKESIDKQGLLKKSRLYVHLSSDRDTAVNVGNRHGQPVVYKVDCRSMLADGFKFYRSVNNVWLTEHVPSKYLSI